jgi:hypothetical protein
MIRGLLFVILLMSLLPVYGFYHIEGVVNDVSAHAITVAGDYAYLTYYMQLKIVDISDPCNPQLLNIVNDLYQGRAVIIDTLAYIAVNDCINIVNVSDPYQPSLVAQIGSMGQIYNFAVSAPYIYYYTSDLMMHIIDISDVADPQSTGSFQMKRPPSFFKVVGGLMYLSSDNDNNSNIEIIDVSNPYNPMLIYTYNITPQVTGITVDGNIVYLAGSYSGIIIWDITDPSQPVQLGIFNPGRAVFDIYIQGNIACLANVYNGILLVDISNPASPQILGTCDTPGIAYRVFYRGDLVYVAGERGLQIVDVSDPLPSAGIIGSYYSQGDDYASLAIWNNYIYLANTINSIMILDVANPSLPELQTEYFDSGAYTIQVVNDKAYIVNRFGSYDILDVSDPGNPQALGSYTDLDILETATVVGSYAYVLEHDEGLKILNISNAASPTLIGTYSDLGIPCAIALRDNYAYIVDRAAPFPKVQIINISNHASPQYAGFCYLPSVPNSIAIYGNYAYITSSSAGLQVYQITNSTSMTLLSTILPHPTSDLIYCFADGGRLYVSDQNWNEIDVYDLFNPAEPSLLHSYKSNYATLDMKVVGNLLYTANEYNGMHIFDLTYGVENVQPLAETQILSLSNYPNPFNPNTTISYTLPAKGHVELNIYNIRGQLIKHLVDDNKQEGTHSVLWDGKDDKDRAIASGIYIYRISSGSKQMFGRMMLLK